MPIQMAKATKPRTKQEYVYQTLRAGIMRCELAANERLVIDDIARQLQVSTIPVREALQMLQSEGLIVTVPHVGATVAPVTRESILDVFTLLEGLGQVATRLVAQRARPDEFARLERLVADMDAAAASAQHEEWARLNTQFHVTISMLPGLPMLGETTERVLDQWHRVRRHFFPGLPFQRVAQAQREHHEMLEAMRRRRLRALQDIVRRHNQGALECYLRFLREQPEWDGETHGARCLREAGR